MVMLAKNFDPKKHLLSNYFASEKFDGMRALWDGGITRGLPIDKKKFRGKYSTGLWSRDQKVIHAPEWWLDQLPDYPLDGELWIDRGCFEEVSGLARRISDPDNTYDHKSEWNKIKYLVFDIPHFEILGHKVGYARDFKYNYSKLQEKDWNPLIYPIIQEELEDEDHLEWFLDSVIELGGEGAMLRHKDKLWVPRRCDHILKVKPKFDAEGVVVNWQPGKGRLEGMMGALIIRVNRADLYAICRSYEWVDVKISGFTDAEREIENGWPKFFPKETKVTFQYNGFTNTGYPREARYLRIRN